MAEQATDGGRWTSKLNSKQTKKKKTNKEISNGESRKPLFLSNVSKRRGRKSRKKTNGGRRDVEKGSK